MTPDALRETLRAAALREGLHRVGFAGVGLLPHREVLERWLRAGMAGEMAAWLGRRVASRADPRGLLSEARTALVAAAFYGRAGQGGPSAARPGEGLVARYARGEDYHTVLHDRLDAVAEHARALYGPLEHRVAVDTSPLLERELAVRAGVGFMGKSTMLVTPGLGTYTVLGVLLLSVEIPPDRPLRRGCGSCRLCLDACPTAALRQPYELDARRCVSYLTIEHRGDLEPALASRMAPWVFGCDACQEVCPHNRGRRRPPPDPRIAREGAPAGVPLEALRALSAGDYRRLVRGRVLRRVPGPQFARNARCAGGARYQAGLAKAPAST